MPNVLSPRDLVSRPDNMDETVLSSHVLYFVLLHIIIVVLSASKVLFWEKYFLK